MFPFPGEVKKNKKIKKQPQTVGVGTLHACSCVCMGSGKFIGVIYAFYLENSLNFLAYSEYPKSDWRQPLADIIFEVYSVDVFILSELNILFPLYWGKEEGGFIKWFDQMYSCILDWNGWL